MDGILIVDKPKGLTSHDVVDIIRNRFNIKKVGHTGTLDPMATGVLVMLIGKYTKSANLYISDDKEYEGTLLLGAVSDTGDATGRIAPSGDFKDIGDDAIRQAFGKFLGVIEQKPPMYSAVKINGRKLYELARKGLTADPKSRQVTIKMLDIINISSPLVSFKVVCSKGTYIRQLAVDIGRELGCGAYLDSLRRTRSGKFGIDGAIDIDSLKALNRPELESRLSRI